EELQAMALFHTVSSVNGYGYAPRDNNLPGQVYPTQIRSFAWGIRTIAQCALVSPISPPSWIQSKATWVANLADNRAYMQLYMNSPAKIHAQYRQLMRSDQVNGFMQDYLFIVLAWIVRMGFNDWKDAYEWAIDGLLQQLQPGGAGWWRGWPDPYTMFMFSD